MILQWIPWSLYDDNITRFWVHYGLIIFGFVLAVITFIVQWIKPAPYGKHERDVSIKMTIRTGRIISLINTNDTNISV